MVRNQHKYAHLEKVERSNISNEMPFRAAQIEELSAANRECLTFGSVTQIDHIFAGIARVMIKLVPIESPRSQLSIGSNLIMVRPTSATTGFHLSYSANRRTVSICGTELFLRCLKCATLIHG